MVKSETTPQKGKSKQKLIRNKERFWRDFGAWAYALVISFFPFVIVFFLFKKPETKFIFWDLFRDYALLYVCVTMSATSLYTYDKMAKGIMVLHIFVLLPCMIVYFLTTYGISLPLFGVHDHRKFIFFSFLLSIVLGFGTILHSSVTRGS
jgi:hypothetical protein